MSVILYIVYSGVMCKLVINLSVNLFQAAHWDHQFTVVGGNNDRFLFVEYFLSGCTVSVRVH